jgi:branched-subunit amino acid permease
MWTSIFTLRIIRINRRFYLSKGVSSLTLRVSLLLPYLITGIDKALVTSFGYIDKHRFIRYVYRYICLLECTNIRLKSLLYSLYLLMSKYPLSIILIINHFPRHIFQLSHSVHRPIINLSLLCEFRLSFPQLGYLLK